ncbi:hypothetical protein BKA93DRAFT_828501 [Sparassis latifolia]
MTLRPVEIIPKPLGLPFLGCLSKEISARSSLASWVTCLTVACVYYVLTIYKLAQTVIFKDWFDVRHIFGKKSPYPIMTAFLRDGSVFFGIGGSPQYGDDGRRRDHSGYHWLRATYSIAGSRLILNLRSLSSSMNTSLDMQSFSGPSPKRTYANALPLEFRIQTHEAASAGTAGLSPV